MTLTPSVRYRSLKRELVANEHTSELDMRYVSIGIGINTRF